MTREGDFFAVQNRRLIFCPSCGERMVIYDVLKEGVVQRVTIHKPCGLPDIGGD